MAAAQISKSDLTEKMDALQDELLETQSSLEKAHKLNDQLISTNKLLVQELVNNRTDIYFMISKTHRITVTNKKVADLMRNIEAHPVIKEILASDAMTSSSMQVALDPLLRVWSHAKNFSHFLPNASISSMDVHTRPVFSIKDLQPFLDAGNRLLPEFSRLIWQFSVEMHGDLLSFLYLRPGFAHKTTVHAYVAVIATLCLYNLYKENKVYYPKSSPYWLHYDSPSYQEVMKTNAVDLSADPEPVNDRQEDLIYIHSQLSRKRKKNKHF